jgi:lipoate-protein ligase A
VSARWRLLLDAAGSGPWNMAVDETLLRSAQRGAPPALRFYTWSGAWLSLGFAQRLDAARREACRGAGVGVVRRATGGSAVLHGEDLTYALAAPAGALPEGLQATYALVGEALSAGLAALGIAAERGARATAESGPRDFDCFQAPAAEEICVGGRKLIGSAQRRAAGGVLQHGSLRLRPDAPAARAAAGLRLEGATSLRELGFTLAPERVRDACIDAFARRLGARFEAGSLETAELAQAHELVKQYANREEFPIPSGFSREPFAGR